MKNQNYYCLISGLPDMVLEQSKAPFSLDHLLEELQAILHPQDFRLVKLIFLPHDNRNLLHLTMKRDAPWDSLGNFSREEMEEQLIETGHLPPYMDLFFHACRQDTPIWQGMSWENQLTRLYYEYVLANTEGFLHSWFAFEKNLKNILAAWNAREFTLTAEGQLIGKDDVTEALGKTHTRDFGLSRDLDFIDKLMHALERDELLERERAIDRIKWNHIDELNTFHYFTVEVVLGYLLKFLLLDRWLQLDAERGTQAVQRKIAVLEDSFEFSNSLN
jgi:hypothetical protein